MVWGTVIKTFLYQALQNSIYLHAVIPFIINNVSLSWETWAEKDSTVSHSISKEDNELKISSIKLSVYHKQSLNIIQYLHFIPLSCFYSSTFLATFYFFWTYLGSIHNSLAMPSLSVHGYILSHNEHLLLSLRKQWVELSWYRCVMSGRWEERGR